MAGISSGSYSSEQTLPIDCPEFVDYAKVKGKTVLITGGSSGLGAAYVQSISEAGAFVINADINPPQDEKLQSISHFIRCDVTVWAEQLAAFQTAIKDSPRGGIDIVIANAGISGSDEFFQDDEGDVPTEPSLKILDINLAGVVYTAKLATFYMGRQDNSFDRCLILKSSIQGYLDTMGSPTYGAAKHGVRSLMKSLRRRSNLRVSLVAPWFIPTPIMTPIVVARLTAQLADLGSGFAEPEDCVRAVMRIATDASVNGRALAVLPRIVRVSGYTDLDLDDYREGSLCYELLNVSTKLTHRQLPSHLQRT
ncbi:uncharacterized protein APUU_30041S [Aspergillus puulaauensis]|uniref:Uncharacterized protein n=1 Tax=Aspergillus puulaauensis TaxID=1220207 RepID=A0A7R7XI59_9EURO|nr:uncharacterized protein APUU_30041S [Aspergillus puulaauensis]BCS21816.1 hypothetical protein APUU_30041S [Aspergillus puulaauensis]